jgi:hypothetical protein
MDAEWSSLSAQLHGSFLDRQIQRTNRNLLLVALVLIVGVVGWAVAGRRYFYNFFAGPFDISPAQLVSIEQPDAQLRYFVKVTGDDFSDTGVQEVERQSDTGVQTVKAKFSILLLARHLLIIKSDPNESGRSFQGELSEIPSDVRSNVVSPLVERYPNASQALLPFMLDATGFRTDGYVALAVGIPMFLLACWLIAKVMRRRADAAAHPVIKAASRYGTLTDVSQQLDLEMQGAPQRIGGASITPSWVVLQKSFDLKLCRIPDLIWAYKKVTRHYHNFIPTGKTYDVIMYDRYGQPLQMQAREKKVDEMLKLLAERAPWAVFGYSNERNQLLRTNWGGFVAAVDQRKSGTAAAAK